MSVVITTYDGRSYEVSDEAAISVSNAMAESWQHVRIPELDMILAIKDIRRMDNIPSPEKKLPKAKPKFQLPADHDCVVVDGSGKVLRSYKLGGFYSDEATAKRREENKIKYMPQWKKDQLAREKKAEEKRKAEELFA